jgi:hypothetical protein
MAKRVQLTMACGLYDRMLDLYKGVVQPDGIELNFIALDGSAGAREIFDRMAGGLEFDVAEMSSSEFVARMFGGRLFAGRAACIPVTRVPARHDRRQSQLWHSVAEGPGRPPHRRADLHNDGGDLDPRASTERL